MRRALVLGLLALAQCGCAVQTGVRYLQIKQRMIDATVSVRQSDGSSGSGFVFKIDGTQFYILTAAHVGEEKNPKVSFFRHGFGWTELSGEMLAREYTPEADVMLIRVTYSGKFLGRLTLAASDRRPRKGQMVMISGRPAGIDPPMVTMGTVYDTGRTWTAANFWFDAGIWYGNSGGPVADAETGEVVGLVTQFDARDIWPKSDRGGGVDIKVIRDFLIKHGYSSLLG